MSELKSRACHSGVTSRVLGTAPFVLFQYGLFLVLFILAYSKTRYVLSLGKLVRFISSRISSPLSPPCASRYLINNLHIM